MKEWCEDILFFELQLSQQSKGWEETGVDIMVGKDLEKESGNITDMDGSVFIKKLKTSSNLKQIGL